MDYSGVHHNRVEGDAKLSDDDFVSRRRSLSLLETGKKESRNMIPLSKSKPDWKSLLSVGAKLGIDATGILDKSDIRPETDLHFLTCLWNLDETAEVNINVFPEFLLEHIHLSFLYHCQNDIEIKLMERSRMAVRSIKTNGAFSAGIISGTLYQWKRIIIDAKDYKDDRWYLDYINKIHELLNRMGYSKIFDQYTRVQVGKFGAYILT